LFFDGDVDHSGSVSRLLDQSSRTIACFTKCRDAKGFRDERLPVKFRQIARNIGWLINPMVTRYDLAGDNRLSEGLTPDEIVSSIIKLLLRRLVRLETA
jgi:hypothetical protein